MKIDETFSDFLVGANRGEKKILAKNGLILVR